MQNSILQIAFSGSGTGGQMGTCPDVPYDNRPRTRVGRRGQTGTHPLGVSFVPPPVPLACPVSEDEPWPMREKRGNVPLTFWRSPKSGWIYLANMGVFGTW